jgi:hypothetical protein
MLIQAVEFGSSDLGYQDCLAGLRAGRNASLRRSFQKVGRDNNKKKHSSKGHQTSDLAAQLKKKQKLGIND